MPNPLGIDDSQFSEGNSFTATLIQWGNETVDELRKSLNDNTSKGTTKNLEQSIIVLPIEFEGSRWVMAFQAEDYWKFVNEGVSGKGGTRKTDSVFSGEKAGSVFVNKGAGSIFSFKDKKPPIRMGEGLSLWAYAKGLNPYAVRESVFQKGIKPTHFFDKAITPEWTQELIKRLEKSGAREIEISFSKEFNNG